ncbi:hypothetical protein ACVWXM_008123 [Bradyrhizobium sp. GM7.3]
MTMETLIREDIVEGGGVAADERRIIQWSSVIAGALAAGAMSFILVGFGVAVGLGVSSASPTWRDASAALALLSGLYLIIQAIISFGFRRLYRRPDDATSPGGHNDRRRWRTAGRAAWPDVLGARRAAWCRSARDARRSCD